MTLQFPLRTDSLILRPFEAADLDSLTDLLSHKAGWRGGADHPRDVRAVLDVLRRNVWLNRPGEVLSVALVTRRDGRLAGWAEIVWHDATAGQAELILRLHPGCGGSDGAFEAARSLVGFAFECFRFHRIFARCEARDAVTVALMRRLGMRLEAHFREHMLVRGEWSEELHFAVLDREWMRASKVHALTHLVA